MMLSLLSQGLHQVTSWMEEGVLKLMGEGVKENLQWGTNWCCVQLPKQLLLKLLQQQHCWNSLTPTHFARLLKGEEDAGGEAAIGEVEDGEVVKATIDDAEATEEAAAATGETAAAVGGDKEPAGELVGDIVEEVELGAIEVILGGAVGLLEVATGALGVVLRERGVSRVPGGVLTGEAGEDPVLVDNADEARGVFEKVGVVGEELGLVL